MTIPLVFIGVAWIVEIIERTGDASFGEFGVHPRTVTGLPGIIFSPFIHGNWEHLVNNTVSFLVLGGLLYSVYGRIASQVLVWSWFLSGFWLWALGRQEYHIGASGVIYALASFHFFSGIIRWNPRLIVISLLVVFLYGYMVWGVLPTDMSISFEGHFAGLLAGAVLAWFFRKEGPARKVYHWDEPDEPADDNRYWEIDPETDEKMR